jgi:hypothetical protein
MRHRLLPSALLIGALMGQPGPLAAQNWELLGTRRVSLVRERDVIEVTAREGLFRALKLEVDGGDLELFDLRVVFGDGSVYSPETRFLFRQGSWSRTLDLPGKARVIRRIEFQYRSTIRRGQATVRVYGKQVERAPGGQDAGRGAEGDWDQLGSRQVSFRAERDVIPAAGEGRFRAIRIVVSEGDLEMFNVRIVFGDGSAYSPETRLVFREGSWSRVIDLPGEARIIRRIEFSYRSIRATRDGRAVVTVYGRR